MTVQAAIFSANYAKELANGAGDLLLRIQSSARAQELGTSALKDRADRAAQQYLSDRLRRERPDDAVLSEEAPDTSARLSARRVWIIDPLDGTREFSEGRHDWAVHVALWEDGELVAGAVSLPGIGEVLSSADSPSELTCPERIRLAVSRSRPPTIVDYLASVLEVELVPMGSAGYKTSAIVRGEVDAYVHTGGQYEWDSAAPVIVARNAGLHTSRIDGSPLIYNRPDPFLPDLLICNPACSAILLEAVKGCLKVGVHG